MTHIKKDFHTTAKAILLNIGLAITLISCGGGGGGGSTYPSITYSGATGAATVDTTNAADFPVTFLEGSTSSAEANPYAIITDSNTSKTAQHTAMLSILADQVKNNIIAHQNNSDNNLVSAATQTSSGTCTSNAGSLTFTDNSTSTNLSGSFTYDNYCLEVLGVKIIQHGKLNYSGSLTLSGNQPIFQSMTLSVEYIKLTVITNTETITEEFSGSMTITFDGTIYNDVTGMTITTNFESGGLTYKIQNLVVDTSSGLNISGRFYHPTHGYVDVTTTTNFNLVNTNPDEYCGGVLRLTGSSGDIIDFTDTSGNCTSYMVCVTPNGGSPSCQPGLTWP